MAMLRGSGGRMPPPHRPIHPNLSSSQSKECLYMFPDEYKPDETPRSNSEPGAGSTTPSYLSGEWHGSPNNNAAGSGNSDSSSGTSGNSYGAAGSSGNSYNAAGSSGAAPGSGYGTSDNTYGPSAGAYSSGNGGFGYGSNSYGSYHSGSGSTPPTPPHGGKVKKAKVKKGWTAPRLVALCLACALVGGGVSGGAFALVTSSQNQAAANTSTSTVLQSDRTPTTNVQTNQVRAGEEMSVSQIYNTYSGSVVSIQVSTDTAVGAGTGFVITEDGYIVTCYHVIDGANEIAVTFSDSTSYEAILVGGDADNDIAVLKIDATGLTPVVLGDSSQLQVGDTVTTIGNALGTLANTTTTGVVSALDRAIEMSDGSVINVLQTDCTVNSGNSGGPLFNAYGEVIGIVNAKYSSSGYSSSASIEGIGFAIPYADVQSKITDLMEYGYITGKPSLGITVSTVSALDAQRYNMVVGAYVNSVTAGSCAETAGLQAGDIITGVNGTEITTYEELVNAKNECSAGDQMTLDVWRDGETFSTTVTLDEEVPGTDTGSSSSDSSGSDGQSQDSQDYSNMTPEDFFNYFFGQGGGQGGW